MTTGLETALRPGPDQPERFLTFWFGPPTREASRASFESLPQALAEWHRRVSRWEAPVLRQNQVPTTRELDGDVLLVGIETQAVWLRGVREAGDNPEVFERENEPGSPWTPTGERLDEYLWHLLLVEAIFGGGYGLGLNNATADELRAITSSSIRLPVRPWRWPGPQHALWRRGALLVWTMVNDRPDGQPPEFYSIFVAAGADSDLAVFDQVALAWGWDRVCAARDSNPEPAD